MGGTTGGGSSFIFILVAFVALWFLMIRPSQQQAKKRAEMLQQLKPGVKIITIGGICGVIKALTENRVFLEIADGLTIEMLRTSISQIVTEEEERFWILDSETMMTMMKMRSMKTKRTKMKKRNKLFQAYFFKLVLKNWRYNNAG